MNKKYEIIPITSSNFHDYWGGIAIFWNGPITKLEQFTGRSVRISTLRGYSPGLLDCGAKREFIDERCNKWENAAAIVKIGEDTDDRK